MISEVITITPDRNMEDALKLMQQHQLDSLPVTYENKLVGMITKEDLKL